MMRTVSATVALLSLVSMALARQAASTSGPNSDSSYIDENGTAHVTRVVPVPSTVSPEAQKVLARRIPDNAPNETLADRRSKTDKWQAGAGEDSERLYPVKVSSDKIAGVPVRIVQPAVGPAERQDRVLINVHGGGFNSDSGSLTETVPIANLTQTKVIAVLYRLAPEHPFPAAVDDTVAVYREVLKTYKPQNIGLYGTSAGAILTAEVAVKLRQLKLPLPAALGVFSGSGDLSQPGDSQSIFALGGFAGHLSPPEKNSDTVKAYAGSTDLRDPVLSPAYADVRGFPPTLFVTSTRDLLLSGTANLHRAFLRSGVDARLVVFEALPHAFWNDPKLPESKEFNQIVAQFFEKQLGR